MRPAAMMRMLEVIGLQMEWEVGLFWSLDRESQHLRCANVWRQPQAPTVPSSSASAARRSFGLGVGLPGRVWASDAPSWLIDVPRDPAFPRLKPRPPRACAARSPVRSASAASCSACSSSSTAAASASPTPICCRCSRRSARRWASSSRESRSSRTSSESEARKAGILEAVLDCIITIDHRGRIVEFNPAAERTFRYKRAEVMGREMAKLIIPPALRAAHREGLARYLATGTGGAIDRRFETTAMRADGTEFPVELSLVRIPSAGPPMFTGFLRDITVQKRMLEQLSFRAAHDGLTQSLNRIGVHGSAADRSQPRAGGSAVDRGAVRRHRSVQGHQRSLRPRRSAINCWWRWPGGCTGACVPPTRWRVLAGTSSPSWSRTSRRPPRWRRWPTASSRRWERRSTSTGISVVGDREPRHRLRLLRESSGRSAACCRPGDVSREGRPLRTPTQ